LPLHLFLAVFIQPPGTADTRFVGQVEQMYASRCSQASKGALGCISCHDPHHYPAVDERVAYYRKHCLQCHERQKPCSLPFPDRQQTSKDDNCVHCHMPAGESNIQHHSITDHRIPRRPADSAPAGSRGDELPMLLFHHDLLAAGDPDVVRDLGIALVDRVERYSPRERRWLGQLALPRLEIAVRADPSDVPAWDAKAHALWAVGDLTGAAADFDEALRQSPRREIALQWAAALAMESKRPEAAASYLERALTVNPWRHEFHSLMAEAQAQRGVWPAAYRECQEAIKLNPANVKAQQLLLEYYVQAGQMDQARTQLERLLGLHPPNAEGLRRWFASRVR
jgi:tetratricopeptide (TPR) repeat protein